MKAILIARVSIQPSVFVKTSSDKSHKAMADTEAGNSLPAQVARLERYCNNKNLEIIQTCSFDESAYKDDRSEFDRIIDLILAHKEKIIVCCDKVDRLSRNVFDKRISVLYEKALNDELELHFISDGQIINSGISAVEKFQFSISLGLAKYYSDAISDNVRRAMEQKLRKGEWLAKAPYGYKNVRVNGVADIIVDDYAAHIVRQAFELYGTGAYSMDLLLAKLKKDFGVVWPKGSFAKMLENPFYYGVMIVKGKKYPHRYPPIISKSVFDQVQKVKGSFTKSTGKYAGLPYIYRGLIRCGDCGLTITPEKHKQFVYYHCTQYNGKHGATWWREDKITEKLAEVFANMEIPENILEQLTETLDNLHYDKIEFHNKEFDKLNREHKTTTKMLDNLYLDKLKGRITESEYDKFYQSLREQVDDIAIRLEHLQEAEDNYYMTAKYVLELTKHAYELFKSSEVEEKRHLIKLVLSNLRIEGENLLWDVQKPFDLIVNCTDRQLWSGWPDSN